MDPSINFLDNQSMHDNTSASEMKSLKPRNIEVSHDQTKRSNDSAEVESHKPVIHRKKNFDQGRAESQSFLQGAPQAQQFLTKNDASPSKNRKSHKAPSDDRTPTRISMQNISVDNLVRQEYPEMIKERLYSIESQEKASDN